MKNRSACSLNKKTEMNKYAKSAIHKRANETKKFAMNWSGVKLTLCLINALVENDEVKHAFWPGLTFYSEGLSLKIGMASV